MSLLDRIPNPAASIEAVKNLLLSADTRLERVETNASAIPQIAETLGVMVQHLQVINGRLDQAIDAMQALRTQCARLEAQNASIQNEIDTLRGIGLVSQGEESAGRPNGKGTS